MAVEPRIISFVAMSRRRRETLLKLEKRMMSQPEIKRETGMYKTHTSRTLKELLEHKLIKCKNPESRAFKFYQITPLGKNVLKEVEKVL